MATKGDFLTTSQKEKSGVFALPRKDIREIGLTEGPRSAGPAYDAKIVLELHLRNIAADIELARSLIEPYDGDPEPYKGERRVSEVEILGAIRDCDKSDRGVRNLLVEIAKKTDFERVEDAATGALMAPC
jgi:hypothetical protein